MTIHVLSLDEFEPPPALEAAWFAALPAARRSHIASWPDAAARRRSLLASRLLREGLLRLGHPGNALAGLHYPPHGKPALDLPVEFSLSHCAGRILCALSTHGPIGVDVEPIGALTAAAFSNFLGARERAWAGDDPRRFCELWTRKEAVVKAAGTLGLAQLRDVEINGDVAVLAGSRWHSALLQIGGDYVACLAHVAPISAPDVRRVTEAMLRGGHLV